MLLLLDACITNRCSIQQQQQQQHCCDAVHGNIYHLRDDTHANALPTATAIANATRNTAELESIEIIVGVPIEDVDIADYNTALKITSRMIISMQIIMLESINLDDVVTS